MPVNHKNASQRRKIRSALRARYGDNCYLCGRPMTFDKAYGNTDAYATIDHLIASVAGGSDKLENLRLAHNVCNNFRNTYQHYEMA